MKSVSSSELKAKLAKYLRLVRQGEIIEVKDRGTPFAILKSIDKEKLNSFNPTPPSEDPALIGKLVSGVCRAPKQDIVKLLLEDRKKR